VPNHRWQRVKELFGGALERPAETRDAYLRGRWAAISGEHGWRTAFRR